MVHIKIKKGLDIPIKGKPKGDVRPNRPSGQSSSVEKPNLISLNLMPYEEVKFKLHAKVGDTVTLGQPIAEDKDSPGRMFVAPAAGTIKEVVRGYKRRILDIVIEVASTEELFDHGSIDVNSASREAIIEKLKAGGIFSHIYQRPFHLLADPTKEPRSIFVKALESAPFVPPSEMQVAGFEKEFQLGLDALTKLTKGKVHLVHRHGTDFRPFTNAENVEVHTAEGPHPVSNASVHIEKIDPIRSIDCVVWTLNAHDVVSIGYLLSTGKLHKERVISIAGPGILENQIGYYKARTGYPVSQLITGRVEKHQTPRFISGDPLTGHKVEADGFLCPNAFSFVAIPESQAREMLHFFRLGTDKYSFSRAYLSGHLNPKKHQWDFTTSQHGEHRAFIDPTLYDEVQPLNVPTMQLVKAVMAEDFDLAEELGLLEVSSEDFALPTFVCPSKMEMSDIIKTGLRRHAADVLE